MPHRLPPHLISCPLWLLRSPSLISAMLTAPAPPPLNLLAGQPYLLLFRCLSMSHRREKAWKVVGRLIDYSHAVMFSSTLPQLGHLWVPLCMCLWCCRLPGCLNSLPHSSQEYRPPPPLVFSALLTQSEIFSCF